MASTFTSLKFSREFLGYIMFRKLQAENIIAYLKASLQKLGDPFRVDIFYSYYP